MKRYRLFLLVALCLSQVQMTLAQTSSETTSALPRLIRFGGTVRDLNGSPLAGVAGITFALYSEPTGGAALWLETQNVTADSTGHYTALLGSTKPEGLPAELFNSEQARWVGVQVQGQAEQPRVLLVSAPYAFKAGDAETIGGLPPSAFMLAVPPASGSAGSATAIAAGSRDLPATATDVTTTGGTANYLPFFTGTSTILDSVVFQTGTGSATRIGINTSTPAATLDVKGTAIVRSTLTLPAAGAATAAAGADSEPLNLAASVFNSGASAAVSQTFQLKTEPVGNDTTAASGALSLLYGSGASAPAETGLQIASNGQITFAAGQAFPGTGGGTVTSVGSGAGLTGGPITSSGTLSIAAAGVTNAMLANQSLTVSAGTDLTGGGPVSLGGSTTLNLDITKVPQLNSANTFTGNQTVSGSLSATGTVTGSGFSIGANLFAFGSYPDQNAFLGFSGNATTNGGSNTAAGYGAMNFNTNGSANAATGWLALYSNTTGSENTASGAAAMFSNTTGGFNTATGYAALDFNTTGSANTATGTGALTYNTTGNNNTATGYSALLLSGTGSSNTATGYSALYNDNTGSNNTATGYQALYNNTTGIDNAGTGYNAMLANTTGSNNTAVGNQALQNNSTGSSNIAIGNAAGFSLAGSGNIDIGNAGSAGDNGAIKIGCYDNCASYGMGTQTSVFIAGIYGVNAGGIPVYINNSGQLGTVSSSRRYKEEIQDMGDASGGLLRLRPVTFRYKKPYSDGSQPIQYGLIAEEVAEVYPDLVARSADGQIETVKYQLLDPMLLNELQKQNATITTQKEQIEAQEQRIHSLEGRMSKLEAVLERTPGTAGSR
jgi:hypothetical protein